MKKLPYVVGSSIQEKWTFDEFIALEPYEINRDVLQRLEKVRKVLSKGFLPTHANVDVGIVVKAFSKYKVGDRVRLNGNTRAELYKLYPELIPPVPFNVNVYYLSSKDETDLIYYSIDNSGAAEKPSEILTGLLREKGYYPRMKYLAKGSFGTSLNCACHYGYTPNGVYLNLMSTRDKFEFFFNDLVYIDSFRMDEGKRFSGSIMAALFMIVKKHGFKNKKVELLMENYKNGRTTISDGKICDGVHFIYNNFYEIKTNWSGMGWDTQYDSISVILYCFDQFVNGIDVPSNFNIKDNNEKLRKYYQFYLPRYGK